MIAHGISGALFFLGKCYQSKIELGKVEMFLDKRINFLISNSHNQYKSCYPSRYISSEFDSGNCEFQFSRLAWCYGDLGVAHTLLLLSNWTNNHKIEKLATEQLKISSSRINKADTLIEDAGFCYGSSGASIIYKSDFHLKVEKEFSEISDYWLNETLKFGKEGAKFFCGCKFQLDNNHRGSDISI